MTRRLEAWLEGRHIGCFISTPDGGVSFSYDATAPATPISLSLARNGRSARTAAAHFLANLLPDEERARARLASAYGARSTATLDLLDAAGGDVAGGLVLVSDGQSPDVAVTQLNPALDRDIADRIASIKRDPDDWAPTDAPARFSLAGTQGKFALARVEGDWYWSNASVPSTHIVKPGRADLRNIEAAEVAALTLARSAGIRASEVGVLHAVDQTAFLATRFDRTPAGMLARRLHAEDMAQALGIAPTHKYAPTVKQVLAVLAPVDADGELARGFLSQLVFNTIVGNADAHAKNYSVLIRPDGLEWAPLYDVVPVGLYPELDQQLAMPIAGARRSSAVSLDHWRKLARTTGRDPDRMVATVRAVAGRVADLNDHAWDALDADQATLLRTSVGRVAEALA